MSPVVFFFWSWVLFGYNVIVDIEVFFTYYLDPLFFWSWSHEFWVPFFIFIGSFSRSAVNYMAGSNTTVSNMIMSLVVSLTLEVITPLFKYTPNAVIAAIIISAVAGLIDIKAAYQIWKVDKLDFLALLGAFFGVVFKSVEIGLLVAVRTLLR